MQCYYPLLWVFALIATARCSPFQLTEKYIAEFEEGIAGLKKLSQGYEYHQEDTDLAAHNATDAEEFDFIVVGGGTSGSVVANRLSQIPEWKVLLLESGTPETKITQIPAMYRPLQTTPYNWLFHTVPQNKSCLGSDEHRCLISEGRALGGTTAINDMLYTRGNHKDYDIWADLGLDGWCWEDVLPFFKKIEDAHVHDIDRKYHSLGGPLHLENFQHTTGLASHILQAGRELDIPTVDYNGKHQLGLALPQVTGKDGKRSGVAQAYLVPAHARKNLVVRPLSHAIEIIVSPHTKEAQGVKYLHDGKLFVAKTTKEVILAAGPINTPQLLMLSGIGPKEDLEHLEIQPVADLAVGKGLKDHLAFIGLNFVFNETHGEDQSDHDAVVDYLKNGKGPLTTTGVEAIGFLKTEASKDATDYPDVELLFTTDIYNQGYEHTKHLGIAKELYDSIWAPLEGKKGFTIAVVLLHPKSSGTLTLHDKDPLHRPLIDPLYLHDEDDHDVDTILAGIHKALKLAHTEVLQALGVHLNVHKVPGCEHQDLEDDYWRCAIRHLSVSLGHVTGTAKMGPKTDEKAVVDEKLRVRGVHKLRVADASVIPVPISGHLTAPVVLIGEKAAQLVREDWK